MSYIKNNAVLKTFFLTVKLLVGRPETSISYITMALRIAIFAMASIQQDITFSTCTCMYCHWTLGTDTPLMNYTGGYHATLSISVCLH